MRKSRSNKRSFALALCVFFVAAILLVSVLAVVHSGHHHLFDSHCTACLQISCVQSLLKQVGLFLTLMGTAFAAFVVSFAFSLAAGCTPFGSLIACKVRMNN